MKCAILSIRLNIFPLRLIMPSSVRSSSNNNNNQRRRRVIVDDDEAVSRSSTLNNNEDANNGEENPESEARTENNDLDEVEREIFADDGDEDAGAAGRDDNGGEENEEDGEDLFNDNMEADYRPIPELDTYDPDLLDDSGEYSDLSLTARRNAEREMHQRDHLGDENHLLYDETDAESTDTAEGGRRKRRKRLPLIEEDRIMEDDEIMEGVDILENMRGRQVWEHVQVPVVAQEIKRRFKGFLQSYRDEKGVLKYAEKIRTMCQENKESLVVEFDCLASDKGELQLAYFLPEAPVEILKIFNEAAKEVVLKLYPKYERIAREIHVRISNLPLEENLRSLRQIHLNQLIKTCGVVTTTTGIMPQLAMTKYDCAKCGYVIGPFVQTGGQEVKPNSCPECQSNGPFDVNVEERY
uniref:DNA replication licensing factor MCM2 n=1 Tax=Romanomermis culicivorax TaxID=13658 RepID=A0A915IQD1_ROMCU